MSNGFGTWPGLDTGRCGCNSESLDTANFSRLPFEESALLGQMLVSLADQGVASGARQSFVRAYHFAYSAHIGQKRESGADYFEHLRGTAQILNDELGCTDTGMLCAAMLHDVVENSPIFHRMISDSPQPYFHVHRRLTDEFGAKVAQLVLAVTKLPKTRLSRQERLERHLEQLSKSSPEVLVLKAADRLHNLRTLDSISGEKRGRIMEETQAYFIPLFEAAASSNCPPWSEYAAVLLRKINAQLKQLRCDYPPVS